MGRAVGTRALVWVTPSAGLASLKYGFNTNMDTAAQSILGQTVVARGVVTSGLVIGANNIKPARASKSKASGSDNSFVDAEAVTTAKAAGWKITPGKNSQRHSTSKTKAVYATINGVKVGFQLPELVGTAKLADMGLVEATATDFDIFYGCSLPRAPRAKTIYTDGKSGSSVYDPTVTLPPAWSSIKSAKLFVS